MKHKTLWMAAMWGGLSLATTACEETSGTVDPYQDWESRNQLYIDSIARVANANLGDEVGQWKVIHSYKFAAPLSGGDVNDYVYCRIAEKGEGTVSPLFSDSVYTHYRGRLIPLYTGSTVTFDQSYTGELDLTTAVASSFALSSVVTGWTTALQQMHAGDRWTLYIPSDLGYGTTGSTSIPAGSTLIFDLYLSKIVPLEPTGRAVEEE
jgi:FKBP-type peptidyl-prolyl cis-trans isomerase FklB